MNYLSNWELGFHNVNLGKLELLQGLVGLLTKIFGSFGIRYL